MQRKSMIWTIIFIIVLVAFTVYVIADTFLISRVYTVVSTDESTSILSTEDTTEDVSAVEEEITGEENNTTGEDTDAQETTTAEAILTSSDPVVTDNSYTDSNIQITITEYEEYDTSIYVADIVLSSADYLQTAFAENSYGKNIKEKTSTIAENVDAILAINGDYYGSQESGYVIRGGTLYRDTSADREDLAILSDGSFTIISESETSAEDLLSSGAQEVFSFGPALLKDGEISVTEDEEVGKAKASNPRTAIGIVDSLHYLFVVSDGRTTESEGLSLYELAEFMQGLDCEIAYNLDGGGSSTMVFMDEVINNPTSDGDKIEERRVSDIVYIGY